MAASTMLWVHRDLSASFSTVLAMCLRRSMLLLLQMLYTVQLAHILAGKGVFCDFSMLGLTTDIHCSSCDEAVLWSKVNFVGAYILLRLLRLKNQAVQPKKSRT